MKKWIPDAVLRAAGWNDWKRKILHPFRYYKWRKNILHEQEQVISVLREAIRTEINNEIVGELKNTEEIK